LSGNTTGVNDEKSNCWSSFVSQDLRKSGFKLKQ
jgi:hypothetical protein